MKRRLHENIYGNWLGFEGARRTQDFGLDEVEAHAWLWGCGALAVYRQMNRERVTRACLIKTPPTGGDHDEVCEFRACAWRVFRRGAWEFCGQRIADGEYCPRHEKSAHRAAAKEAR